MNVPGYLRAHKMSINALHRATGIAYSTLRPHVTDGKELSPATAKKLADWSNGEMTVIEILGLAPTPAPAARPTRKRTTRAPRTPKPRPVAAPAMRKAS